MIRRTQQVESRLSSVKLTKYSNNRMVKMYHVFVKIVLRQTALHTIGRTSFQCQQQEDSTFLLFNLSDQLERIARVSRFIRLCTSSRYRKRKVTPSTLASGWEYC